MKTLIVYTSTYGYAEECARSLAAKLSGQVEISDAEKSAPPPEAYNAVILGGSVYMGRIQKKLREYMDANLPALKQKKIGLFLCCGLPENLEQSFSLNFPKELLDTAVARECFGGVLDAKKMSFGHRMIVKMMESAAKKEGRAMPSPLPENISKLAEAMK